MTIVENNKILSKKPITIIGEVIWIEETVFYCKNCDKQGASNGGRYDYAIVFKNDYENFVRCRKCNNSVELVKPYCARMCPPAWNE